MPDERTVTLLGKVFLRGNIRAVTGLHIGGSAGALSIGGVDNPIVRDPLTNQPYIPGSSLKGKLRSLSEKRDGRPQNFSIGQNVYIHTCGDGAAYAACRVCPAYGIPMDASKEWARPTRLSVRDVALTAESAEALGRLRTDALYAEVKWEAAIDRVTSAATPRQIERVPADAVFGPAEVVFSVYLDSDITLFGDLLLAMQLLEDDALGGQGSRGSGKVAFEQLAVTARNKDTYGNQQRYEPDSGADTVSGLLAQGERLLAWLRNTILPVQAAT